MRWCTRRALAARDLLQDHVPERVLAAARLRTPPSAPRRDGSGLPSAGVWLAVSDRRLYAFAVDDGAVGPLVAVWDRDAVTVTRVARLGATRLAVRVGVNGTPVELDAPRGAGRRVLVRYLLDPRRTA